MQAYFQEKEWPVAQHATEPILRFEYQGEHGTWFCYARAREDARHFIFLSVVEEKVPEALRPAMAEFLTRVNFGLNIGNFELDLEDGEVRYKTSLAAPDLKLTSRMIDPAVESNLQNMDDYLPGIQAVSRGEQTALAAFEAVTKAIQDEADSYDSIV